MIKAIKTFFSKPLHLWILQKNLYDLKDQVKKDHDILERLDTTCQFLMAEFVSANMLETKYASYTWHVSNIEKYIAELGSNINKLQDKIQLIEVQLAESKNK